MTQLGKQLIEGMENAFSYARGEPVTGTRTTTIEVPDIDVRKIRQRLDLTQKSFAESFGFSLSAVRNWEQGTRRPERAARILLAVIERHPNAVRDTLAELESVGRSSRAKRRADKRAML